MTTNYSLGFTILENPVITTSPDKTVNKSKLAEVNLKRINRKGLIELHVSKNLQSDDYLGLLKNLSSSFAIEIESKNPVIFRWQVNNYNSKAIEIELLFSDPKQISRSKVRIYLLNLLD